jgi:hypothetical protein
MAQLKFQRRCDLGIMELKSSVSFKRFYGVNGVEKLRNSIG